MMKGSGPLSAGEEVDVLTMRSVTYSGTVESVDDIGIMIKRSSGKARWKFGFIPWTAIEIVTPHRIEGDRVRDN